MSNLLFIPLPTCSRTSYTTQTRQLIQIIIINCFYCENLTIIWNKCNKTKASRHPGTTAPMRFTVRRVALLKTQVLWDMVPRRRTSILKDCSKESSALKTKAPSSFGTPETIPVRTQEHVPKRLNLQQLLPLLDHLLFAFSNASDKSLPLWRNLYLGKWILALKSSLHSTELNLVLPVPYGVSLFIKV